MRSFRFGKAASDFLWSVVRFVEEISIAVRFLKNFSRFIGKFASFEEFWSLKPLTWALVLFDSCFPVVLSIVMGEFVKFKAFCTVQV
jgi:hypothetical protein